MAEEKIVIDIDPNISKKPKREDKNWTMFTLGVIIFFFILIFLIYSFFSSSYFENFLKKKHVIIYELKGPIVSYKQSQSIYLDQVLSDLEKIKRYDGLIIKIDSPGGDAYATKKIVEKLKEIKKDLPIVSCVDQIATSGAYWLISVSDYIVADEFSIVGSIGVLASYFEFTGLMEKLGIKYNRIVFGKYKDMLSPFKNLTEEEKELILKKLSYLYEYFVKDVSNNRKLNLSFVKENIATGEFYFGYEAKDLGLIDEFGDIETCKEKIAELLNSSISDISFNYVKGYYEEEFNIFAYSLGRGFASYFVDVLEKNNGFKS